MSVEYSFVFLNKTCVFYFPSWPSKFRSKQITEKQSKQNNKNEPAFPPKKNAMPFKLQLHFSLPWEQPRQGPRPLADPGPILSSPHCSWHHGSCVASRIFDLTRLFLSGSGREQGSCQFESRVHTWRSRLDRPSGGRGHVRAIRARVTWASLPISQITPLASSYPAPRGPVYHLAS